MSTILADDVNAMMKLFDKNNVPEFTESEKRELKAHPNVDRLFRYILASRTGLSYI